MLCSNCAKKAWPLLIAVFISAFTGFLTWLTLSSAGVPEQTNLWFTVGAAATTLVLLVSYMLSCMRRHCRHHPHHAAHG